MAESDPRQLSRPLALLVISRRVASNVKYTMIQCKRSYNLSFPCSCSCSERVRQRGDNIRSSTTPSLPSSVLPFLLTTHSPTPLPTHSTSSLTSSLTSLPPPFRSPFLSCLPSTLVPPFNPLPSLTHTPSSFLPPSLQTLHPPTASPSIPPDLLHFAYSLAQASFLQLPSPSLPHRA